MQQARFLSMAAALALCLGSAALGGEGSIGNPGGPIPGVPQGDSSGQVGGRQASKPNEGFRPPTAGTQPPKSGQNTAVPGTPINGYPEGDKFGKTGDDAVKTATEQAAVKKDSAQSTGHQSDEDGRYSNLTSPGDTVEQKVSKLDREGSDRFYIGVVQVATAITQVSLSHQERAENGDSEESRKLSSIGFQNLGEGMGKIDSGREIVGYANKVAASENKRSSVGSSGALPIHNLAFERDKAGDGANEKLKEMEEVAGVSATSFIDAVNNGGGRDEIISFAGSAKGVQMSEADVASIPTFSFSTSAQASYQPSAPTASGAIDYSGAAKGLDGSLGKKVAAAIAEKRSAVSSFPRAPASGTAEVESLQSLGADNLLSSISGKEPEQDGSLFSRVRHQYSKRFQELANSSKSGSAR